MTCRIWSHGKDWESRGLDMWHTPTHNDLCKKQENDVGRQVPSKQDDDAVLDGDKKAISTQLHNSVIYKALHFVLFFSLSIMISILWSVYSLWSLHQDQSVYLVIKLKVTLCGLISSWENPSLGISLLSLDIFSQRKISVLLDSTLLVIGVKLFKPSPH